MQRLWILIAAAWGLISLAASAQETGYRPTKKTAEEALAQHVNAIGGKAALDKIKTGSVKGVIKLLEPDAEGSFEILFKTLGGTNLQFYQRQSIGGVMESTLASDGKTGWEKNSLTGLRDLPLAEIESMKRNALLGSYPHRWREAFAKAEMLGLDKLDGKTETFVIRLSPKEGAPLLIYLDAKSFLMVRYEGAQPSPQGDVEVRLDFSDFRTLDGVKTPYVTKVTNGAGATLLMTVKQAKNNVAISDSKFAKPKE